MTVETGLAVILTLELHKSRSVIRKFTLGDIEARFGGNTFQVRKWRFCANTRLAYRGFMGPKIGLSRCQMISCDTETLKLFALLFVCAMFVCAMQTF